MIVSLNPTYYCNFRCPFCYLTPEQLADKKTASLDLIYQRFTELVSYGEKIECVDIYGGEISQLGDDYARSLLDVIRSFSDGRINIISNLSHVPSYFYDDDVSLYVSYDYKARQDHGLVYQNMMNLDREFNILMLASRGILRYSADEIITKLNQLDNLVDVEIKPYSTNQSNVHPVSFIDFENFVKGFIESDIEKRFSFGNEELIKTSLSGKRNAFSDDHIYITPSGKYAVLEFDENDNEFFLELDSYEDYIKWTEKEKIRVQSNLFCSSCSFYGSCLSEHLREVKDDTQSCNGFKRLLEWYDRKNMEI